MLSLARLFEPDPAELLFPPDFESVFMPERLRHTDGEPGECMLYSRLKAWSSWKTICLGLDLFSAAATGKMRGEED